MFALIFWMIKLMAWTIKLSVWLFIALVVLMGWLITTVTGHDRAARSWARSMPRVPWP